MHIVEKLALTCFWSTFRKERKCFLIVRFYKLFFFCSNSDFRNVASRNCVTLNMFLTFRRIVCAVELVLATLLLILLASISAARIRWPSPKPLLTDSALQLAGHAAALPWNSARPLSALERPGLLGALIRCVPDMLPTPETRKNARQIRTGR